MKLQRYLDRIGYCGTVEPNFETLAALQEAHVCSVPFENLDVQLGRSLTTRIEDAYEKIVASVMREQRREASLQSDPASTFVLNLVAQRRSRG